MDKNSNSINVQLIPVEEGGTVDLLQIWYFLLENWKLIVITAITCLLLTTVYLATKRPAYEATFYLSSPTITQLEILSSRFSSDENDFGKDFPMKSLSDVFLENMRSRKNRLDFYKINEGRLVQSSEESEEKDSSYLFEKYFNSQIFYKVTPKTDRRFGDDITISYRSHDSEVAKSALNDFVDDLNRRTFEMLNEKYSSKLISKKEYLEAKISHAGKITENFETELMDWLADKLKERENNYKFIIQILVGQLSEHMELYKTRAELSRIENKLLLLDSGDVLNIIKIEEKANTPSRALPVFTPLVLTLSVFNGIFLGVLFAVFIWAAAAIKNKK